MEISVVINTKNEEACIERCLKSVAWADEIVVMDMNSTDGTVAIARRHTANVFTCPEFGYVEPARNLAIAKATKDWILVLDADELVPEYLASNIRELISRSARYALIAIPRRNYIGNHLIKDSGWGADHQPRLFKQGTVDWGSVIHSWPRVNGEIRRLDPEEGFYIDHYNFDDLSEAIARINAYTSREAEALIESGRRFEWRDILGSFVKEFSKRYTPKEDHVYSLMLAGSFAFYKFLTYCKALEKLDAADTEPPFALPANAREILKDIMNLPAGALDAAGADLGEASVLQVEFDTAKKRYAAEKLKFDAITNSRAFKFALLLGRLGSGFRKPFDLPYRLFKRTRCLTLAAPLPRCLGVDGAGSLAGSYRLRHEEPPPVLLVRVGGRNWECKVEPLRNRKKKSKSPPLEFRFSCEFTAQPGLQILQLLHSRAGLRTKELLATSLVWGAPFKWAPRPFRRSAEINLSFPAGETPLVSIIIPVCGNRGLTLRCLESVMANTRDVEYEVIIGNDRSEKPLVELLASIPGLRISSNPGEPGFLQNCNQAAAIARGKYLLFLNNDTEVKPGWLPPLVDVFKRFPDAGAAGSKLINADGTLQEAGGIIWRDASGANYGRNDDPKKADYNYLKEVDYCSAASLIVERELFERLGAFSPEFAPGYYEDTDLCFKIREAGRRVYYQPLSEVMHFEGGTAGTDLATGMKRWQAVNRDKFAAKWDGVLKASHQPRGVRTLRARERSQSKKLAVFFDRHAPLIDQDAGSRSTYQYIKLFLDAGVSVKFVGNDFKVRPPYTEMLEQMGVEVLYGESYSRNIHEWLDRNAGEIDAIFTNRTRVTARNIDAFRRLTRARILFYGHDIESVRLGRLFELNGNPAVKAEADAEAELEMTIWQSVDAIYYPSAEEIKYVHSMLPSANARAIPLNICEPLADDYAGTLDQRRDIMFVGGFRHHPNEDAVLAFLDGCWPYIEARLPDCKFHIVGSNPPESILRRASKRIIVTGWIADAELDSLYKQARLVVVPLRYGGGVKGKVVEAVRHNVPLVMTPVAAEGLPGIETCGTIAGINDDPSEFASAVLRLYGDDVTLPALSAGCAPFIRKHFSAAAAREILAADIPWLQPQ